MLEPLTDEELAAMEKSFGMATWHADYRNGLRLIAEVRKYRAENADLRQRVDSLKAGCALANEIMERQEAARREASYDE